MVSMLTGGHYWKKKKDCTSCRHSFHRLINTLTNTKCTSLTPDMSCSVGSSALVCVRMSQRSTKSPMRVSWAVYYDLKQLDIYYATPTHRGTNGGQCRLRAPEPIPPIVTTTRNSVVKQTGVNVHSTDFDGIW